MKKQVIGRLCIICLDGACVVAVVVKLEEEEAKVVDATTHVEVVGTVQTERQHMQPSHKPKQHSRDRTMWAPVIHPVSLLKYKGF